MNPIDPQLPSRTTRETTPREVIDAMVRSICGREVERIDRLAEGSLNEVYRGALTDGTPIVVRIARKPEAWFTHEERLMARARGAGVPTPEVLGVGQVEYGDELLSFSVLRCLPGRPLAELAGALPARNLERLIGDGGELLARLHGVAADGGVRHDLEPLAERFVARVVGVADRTCGPGAGAIVERGAALLDDLIATRTPPECVLSHGDWLPKHFLIDEGALVGILDWEFAGPAPPAFDLAHWETSAGDGLHERTDWLRQGYARVADPEEAAAGWVPAFAIHRALDVLGWKNPATPDRLHRCVEVIARYVGS